MVSRLFDQSHVVSLTSQDYSYDSSLDISHLCLCHVKTKTIKNFGFSNGPSWLINPFLLVDMHILIRAQGLNDMFIFQLINLIKMTYLIMCQIIILSSWAKNNHLSQMANDF